MKNENYINKRTIINGFEKTPEIKMREAEQFIKLQKNSDRIKKIIQMTRDVNTIPKIVETPEPIKEVSKQSFIQKIKSYFKGLFYKYFIEPEVKKYLETLDKEKIDKEEEKLNELRKRIYETKNYERERYYNNLTRTRKESGGYVGNKVPLLVDIDLINVHNQEPKEGKPSLKALIMEENNNVRRIFSGKEKQKERIEKILRKEPFILL